MRKRKPGESVADLGDDIWSMAQKAYYNFGHKAQEQLALKHFYRTLDTDMKVKCVENHCSTIADGVDVVMRYEALYEDRKEAKRANVRAADVTRQNSTNDMLQEVLNKLGALESRQKI